MSTLFANMVKQHTPKVNEHVMDGIACLYMKYVEEYIDNVFRSASLSFPEGIKYHGYERCTPYEDYDEDTKVKNNKRNYDLADSDLYMVKYKFSHNGEMIKDRYIYLPYVRDGGIISLGGTKYHITPVLSDKVISPGIDNIFVRLLRDKLIFKRCYHSYIVDDERKIDYVIWSNLYRKTKDKKVGSTTKSESCIAHYLFAKYGFSETFNKYVGCVPIVGEEDITVEKFPINDWVIVKSHQIKPKSYMGKFYEPNNIRIAIPRDKWNNISKGLLVSFFYIVDHFPNRIKPAYVDNTSLWMILLGHILFSGNYGENKLFSNIEEHFISLNDYVDGIVIEKLAENNYHITNFYDLLALIIDIFNSVIVDNENSSITMFGKNLEVLYYVLYDITSGIFKVNFKFNKLLSKKGQITTKDVIETFNRILKPRPIFKLTSGRIILESVTYSGDHKYIKITSKITKQESLPGGARSKSKRVVVSEDKYVHVSMAEAGSLLYLSKKNPTPTNRINPFVNIDLKTGTIIPNLKFDKLREKTTIPLNNKK
jgi:hypothetical protein